MRVEVRLFATLAPYLPKDCEAGSAFLDLAEGSTVGEAAAALGLPQDLPRIVLVNGEDAEEARRLRAGDVMTLFPPLAGGSRR